MDETKDAAELASEPDLTPQQRAATNEVYQTLKRTASVMHDLFGGSALSMVLTIYLPGDEGHPNEARPVTLGVSMSNDPDAVGSHLAAATKVLEAAAERLEKQAAANKPRLQ